MVTIEDISAKIDSELSRKLNFSFLYMMQKEGVDMHNFIEEAEVLSCAAPNIKASRMIDSKKVQAVISRIKFVLDILEKEACDTVILGAFGCGVFGNDPRFVAKTFRSQGGL